MTGNLMEAQSVTEREQPIGKVPYQAIKARAEGYILGYYIYSLSPFLITITSSPLR